MQYVILAAAEGESNGALGVVLPEAAELVYGLIAFVIVYLILSKVAFPRLNVMLDERRHAIQGRLEEADAKYREAEQAKQSFEASIADAKGEAARIVDAAKQEAEQVRANLIREAEAEAATVRERAQADAALERDRALLELRSEVGALSVELASKIVEKEIDPTTHRALVDEYIQSLSRSN
jgi:F-type H+-transporting ATPase subunit b